MMFLIYCIGRPQSRCRRAYYDNGRNKSTLNISIAVFFHLYPTLHHAFLDGKFQWEEEAHVDRDNSNEVKMQMLPAGDCGQGQLS